MVDAADPTSAVQRVSSEIQIDHEGDLKRKRVASSYELSRLEAVSSISLQQCYLPVPARAGESISQYFARLPQELDLSSYKPVDQVEMDGVYIHKRPLIGVTDSGYLSNCGSVYHHCIVYVKVDDTLHSFDFAPSNGSDVSANLFEEHPPRPVHNRTAVIPPEDTLPFLYMGKPKLSLEDPVVQQAVEFAGRNRYHAIKNNCINFADFFTRILTQGAVLGAPLLYDAICGSIPAQDNPLVVMLMLMTGLSWQNVCDGSRLMHAFVEAHPSYLTTLPLNSTTHVDKASATSNTVADERPAGLHHHPTTRTTSTATPATPKFPRSPSLPARRPPSLAPSTRYESFQQHSAPTPSDPTSTAATAAATAATAAATAVEVLSQVASAIDVAALLSSVAAAVSHSSGAVEQGEPAPAS